jgi:peroxidase
MGPLVGTPSKAVVAGDVRANENIALTSIHTLFAREHNRIVGLLPTWLSQEDRFQLARRVVGAEIQFITYNEFLPSLGVRLSTYRGYDSDRNPGLGNEFAEITASRSTTTCARPTASRGWTRSRTSRVSRRRASRSTG